MTHIHGPILRVEHVSKRFYVAGQEVRALKDITIDIMEGECLAIVGESGSGKSTLANIILGVYPPSDGAVLLESEELPEKRLLEHRRAIQLVQQNPLSALNPRRSVGASLRLALDIHKIGARSERKAEVGRLLEEVGLPSSFASRSPAALSGGQRQRVAIARAMACRSQVVVLDEPTSALDVIVQARVLKLLDKLRRDRGLTYVFITHDLSVVRNIADRVAVFEKGRLVESGPVEAVFSAPLHPYTRRLIGAVPVITKDELHLRQRLKEPKHAFN